MEAGGRRLRRSVLIDLLSVKEIDEGFIEKTKHGGLYGGVCKYKFIGEFKDFHYKGYRV